MWFVLFSYYKTANRTASCGVVRCGALLLAVQFGYAILRVVLVRFVRFSYYKTANRTASCSVVWCGALLLAVRCGYAILQAVLVRFLQFVRFIRFGEHP